MCRGSSVADIYSKSASEGSSICGTLSERCRPAPSSPLMPRPLGIGETLDDGDPQREGLWRRNQKPGAKEHFQKESEGELCITKQQKSLKQHKSVIVLQLYLNNKSYLVHGFIKCADYSSLQKSTMVGYCTLCY